MLKDEPRIKADEGVTAMAGTRVMVVDDEPAMLDILQVNLEQAGYDVLRAHDGVEAWRVLDLENCDAVVLDLSMPRMSGFRFARLLRRDSKWKGIPVVVVSAYSFEEVEEIADEGIQGFVTKPFDPADLVGKLEHALSRVRRASVRVA